MKLPHSIFKLLSNYAWSVAERRYPDEVLRTNGNRYLSRWFAIPHNRFFNIYVHIFHRSDDDRALHDHPWSNMSVLIHGHYFEHLADGMSPERVPGFVYLRKPSVAHRVQLRSTTAGEPIPTLTLFVTGPHWREWGFWCPNGWRHWKRFTKQISEGQTAGCGEYE